MSPPAPRGRASSAAEIVAGAIDRIAAEVDQEIRDDFWATLGISGPDELAGRLDQAGDPSRPAGDIVIAIALAHCLPDLAPHIPALAARAAADQARFLETLIAAAARPRRRVDQDLLRGVGIDWRYDDSVETYLATSKGRLAGLQALAAGEPHQPSSGLLYLQEPRDLRAKRFRQRARIDETIADLVEAALGSGELERARELISALHGVREDDAYQAAIDEAPLVALERASALVRAYRELGEKAPLDLLREISSLSSAAIDRARIDRLAGDRGERALAHVLADPEKEAHWAAAPEATGVADFERQARAMLRAPDAYRGPLRPGAEDEHEFFIKVADAAAFRRLLDRYASHPAFTGCAVLSSSNHGYSSPKSELCVGMRLAFRDEEGNVQAVWAVVYRGYSGARTLEGRTKACRVDSLGLAPQDIALTRSWARARRDSYRPPVRDQEEELPTMPASIALAAAGERCAHPKGEWSATGDGDALRLSCPDCNRRAIAVIPRHRLPEQAPGAHLLAPLDEDRYMARQRFHAILAGGAETASSLAQMSERDGLVWPSAEAWAIDTTALSRLRPAQSMRAALGRRR